MCFIILALVSCKNVSPKYTQLLRGYSLVVASCFYYNFVAGHIRIRLSTTMILSNAILKQSLLKIAVSENMFWRIRSSLKRSVNYTKLFFQDSAKDKYHSIFKTFGSWEISKNRRSSLQSLSPISYTKVLKLRIITKTVEKSKYSYKNLHIQSSS